MTLKKIEEVILPKVELSMESAITVGRRDSRNLLEPATDGAVRANPSGHFRRDVAGKARLGQA
jgi:hypothetical protein